MFLEFFLSPHLRSLQSLSLTLFYAAGSYSIGAIDPSDDAAAFAALVELRRLYLECISDIDILLPHVSCAPQIEQIILAGDVSLLPSLAVLTRLMEDKPNLQCTIIVAKEQRKQLEETFYEGMFEGRLEIISKQN
jgi:hypothetical protein